MKGTVILCAAIGALVVTGCQPPTITTQPVDQTVRQGSYAWFHVEATGNPSPTYQWQKQATDFTWGSLQDAGTMWGSTTPTLYFLATVPSDSGSYRVQVANSSGSVTSQSADLTFLMTPLADCCVSWWQGEGNGADVYALNPGIVSGSGVTFSPGQDGQAFTFNGAGSVRMPASPSLNVGAGGGFTVEAWVKPETVSAAQPILEWNAAGVTGVAIWIAGDGTLTLSASIRDEALVDPHFWCYLPVTPGVFHHVALTYDPSQSAAYLYLDDQAAGSASWTSTLLLPALTIGDFYLGYSPSNDLGTGTHFSGQIDEVAMYNRAVSQDEIHQLYLMAGHKPGIAPRLITLPGNQTANVGNTVALEVVAAGTSLAYQWFFNSVAITDANGPVLTLTAVQANQAGSYSFTVGNALGSVGGSAVLTVNPVPNGTPGPTIVTQPASQTTACAGGPFSLTVAATGSGSLQYQWCKDGININGATASSFTCSQAAAADAGTYSVVVYDSVGQVTSADAVVTVPQRPTAVVSGDATVASGVRTIIQALLTGAGPWTLTWHRDGETGPGSYLVQSNVVDNPHGLTVIPAATTIYKLTSLVDASTCQATAADLTGQATVTVTGAPEQPPANAGIIHLAGGTYNGFTFAGDSTYYVDGKDADGYDSPVHLYGTTTIEGGAVVRFSSSSYAKIVIHELPIVCDTGPYRPAIFAWANVEDYGYYGGWEYTEATHFGQGLSLALPSGSDVVLKNLRFYNLDCGISIDDGGGGSGTSTYKIYDSQFVDCGGALGLTEPNGCTVKVLNALFCDDESVMAVNSAVQASHIDFQHVTADACGAFVSGLSSAPYAEWSGVNSLLVNITNQASIPASLPGPYVQVVQGNPFTTGGDGLHYLVGQTYRGIGSLSIDSVLYAELPQKTTHPPLDFPLYLYQCPGYYYYAFQTSGSLTLSPQVPRCLSNGSLPDLGYAYDVLDYTLSNVELNEGAQVTVLPGTAIGFRFDYWLAGFILDQGTSFVSQGMPNKPITYVPVSLVQEGPFMPQFVPGLIVPFIPTYWPDPDSNPDGAPPPSLDFRFSNFYLNSGLSHHFWGGVGAREMFDEYWLLTHMCLAVSPCSAMFLQLRDCNFHSGWFNLGEPDGDVVLPTAYNGPLIPGSVVLMNNLFDRVNSNFDPDTGPEWWGGPYTQPTVELSLLATNNLFRGGWLFLQPIPSQAPEWAFVNNLLDTTTIAQDATQPFYYDYNGYYPQGSPYQLIGPGGGAHDVVLDQAPPYQPGPLGNFYLPNTLPGTAQLFNKGSCLPGDIGLYHYTTRLDQTKAGEETGNVSIGLHYIAVGTSGQPKDSDTGGGDGIPDYVENWHGDGRRDWPDETDWQTPSDPTSSVYDDVDLSGNGLVGRIKTALGMNALANGNPLPLTQASTGQEPDIMAFDLPLDYSVLSAAGTVQLAVDGAPIDFYSLMPNPQGKYRIKFNSTFIAPGDHLFCARFLLSQPGGKASDSSVTCGDGPVMRFQINNILVFDPFYTGYSSSAAWIYAQLGVQEATYSISLYDPSSSAPPFSVMTGNTTGGLIKRAWDPSSYTGSSVRAVVTVTPTVGATESHSLMLWPWLGLSLTPPSYFTTAWTWDHLSEAIDQTTQQGVVDTVLNPFMFGGANPYWSGFNRLSGAGHYAGKLTTQVDVDGPTGLMQNLADTARQADTRNFFFFGHGDPIGIGDGGRGMVRITASAVGSALGNGPMTLDGTGPRARPYRFVFLNACDTAKGFALTDAFGISRRITVQQVLDRPDAVQGFLGWDGTPRFPVDDNDWPLYTAALNEFFIPWMMGATMHDAAINANDQDHSPVGSLQFYFPLDGVPKGVHWEVRDGAIRIMQRPKLVERGYPGITRDGFGF